MNQPNLVPPRQRRLGRYDLLYRIASGGMANVYLARLAGSGGFEKLVAIKRVHEHLTEDEDFIKMLVDEARLTAQLAHPNVVAVLELGSADNAHYMVMEYVHGESLLALVRKQRPPVEICAKIIAQAAAGLHAAHELRDRDGELLGVIHRDVSPGNILISYDGAVKVADFGVAQARGNLHMTAAGNVKGKIAYMAPEQARRDPLDRRLDIFALGIVLYEVCTRSRLFKGKTEADSIAKLIALEVPRPSTKIKDFPPSLERIILRALERDPDQRFQTCEEFQTALEGYLLEAGKSVLPKHIAELMKEVFGDRIQERNELLARCLRADLIGDELPGLGSDDGTAGSLGGSAGSFSHRISGDNPVARRRWQIGAAAAVVVAAGVVAYVLLRGEPPPVHKPPPTGSQAVRTISISVRATPAHASVMLANEAVGNPSATTRNATPGEAALVVAAPGYRTQRLPVDLQQGGRFVIALERILPDAGVPRDAAKAPFTTQQPRLPGQPKQPKKPKKPKTPKTPKTPKDLFGDPFAK